RTLRIEARDLVQPAFPFGLVRDRQREIAAAGFPADDQMRHSEIAAVGPYPSRAGRTVVQPGRIGVRAEFAAGVTKLDPEYDKSCGSKIFASAREPDVGGATDRHASAVQVHHRGQYAGLVGAADVERDVVAVLARDGGGRGGDTFDVRYGP